MLAETPGIVGDLTAWAGLVVALGAVCAIAWRLLGRAVIEVTRTGFDKVHHNIDQMRQENTTQHAAVSTRLTGVESSVDALGTQVQFLDNRTTGIEDHLLHKIEKEL